VPASTTKSNNQTQIERRDLRRDIKSESTLGIESAQDTKSESDRRGIESEFARGIELDSARGTESESERQGVESESAQGIEFESA